MGGFAFFAGMLANVKAVSLHRAQPNGTSVSDASVYRKGLFGRLPPDSWGDKDVSFVAWICSWAQQGMPYSLDMCLQPSWRGTLFLKQFLRMSNSIWYTVTA